MSRVLTFRGTIEIADGAISGNNKIFSYEASDLTKAWKVTKFYFWPEQYRLAGSTAAHGQFLIAASLATDILKTSTYEMAVTVNDNRQFAWMMKGYNERDDAVDFITGPTGILDNEGIVDPDHIINRDLYLNAYSCTESSVAEIRSYCYLVILEPVKITENEAILQMVKGVAQDIDN
tara:strand:+ start:240 stop:770 length:531 start_codon:yes stop_codon:yes gene_type:complete